MKFKCERCGDIATASYAKKNSTGYIVYDATHSHFRTSSSVPLTSIKILRGPNK